MKNFFVSNSKLVGKDILFSRARFSPRITNMEDLKKEKMRSKCSYTMNRDKLMMAMEGGLSSRTEVTESLNVFLQTPMKMCFEPVAR